MQSKELTIELINNVVDRIIDIKYDYDRIFNFDSFKMINNNLKLMEDAIVTNIITKSTTFKTDDSNIFENYTTLDWFKDKKKQFIKTNIYDKFEKITEIRYCYNLIDSNSIATIKLKSGYIHCEDGPAFICSDFRQYYLYSDNLSYEEWVKHPILRRSKINKIRNK